MSNNKLMAVEGIRGVAAFLVILSHLTLTFFPYLHSLWGEPESGHAFQLMVHNSPFGFIYSGTAAVYIFFVLSGYILSYVALNNNIDKLISMSLKRYPRLLIPALVSSILAFFLFKFIHVDKSILTNWINNYGNFNFSLIGAIYSGLFKSFFIGVNDYNPVLWTMQIELIGSFLIFILCYLYLKKIAFYNVFVVIGTLLSLVAIQAISPRLGLGLIAFIAGYLFYIYGKSIGIRVSAVLFILGLYLAGIHNNSSSYSIITSFIGSKSYTIGNFIAGILIVYSIIFNESINLLFSNKIFVFMGKVSFSVYLIHLPIISTLGIFLFNVFRQSLVYNQAALLSSALSIIIIYFVAIVYYTYVDLPGMIASNNFQKLVSSKLRQRVK